MNRIILIALSLSMYLPSALADDTVPFADCPSNAFIIDNPGGRSHAYGLNLKLGSYNRATPNLGNSTMNGAGFNAHDKRIYSWDTNANTLNRTGGNYVTQPLTIMIGNVNADFLAGDVASQQNAWYGYQSGLGLYSIDLGVPQAPLFMEQVSTAAAMGNPSISDMAFHPTNGFIYAVDNDGFLLRINPANGQVLNLGNVISEATEGFSFSFGAQFFDADENLYISNNGNGHIFRIDLKQTGRRAVFLAFGPTSSSADGARCAQAEVENTDEADFGDAPDFYATLLADNGPRHAISDLFLGTKIDGEADAYTFPLSDDEADNNDDDDGVTFLSGLEAGETVSLSVVSSSSGAYLNGWIDFDHDGVFDPAEQVMTDTELQAGQNFLLMNIPGWAFAGATWARFRVSSTTGIGPTGSVNDGEVEDYPITITEENVSVTYYPSSSTFTTIAYEDMWPIEGDFDMNDMLVNLRIAEYRRNNQVVRLEIDGKVAAVGAEYQNGLGLQLPGILRNLVEESATRLTINGIAQAQSPLETGQTNAVFIIANNIWHMTDRGEAGCSHFRTQDGCGTQYRPSWRLVIPFSAPLDPSLLPPPPYDPFIFATPGTGHGNLLQSLLGGNPGRQLEIHMKNMAPTDAFADSLSGSGDDRSSASQGLYFQNADGMPWALEMPQEWKHPRDGVHLKQAYPQFTEYARARGQQHKQWYLESNAILSLLFVD